MAGGIAESHRHSICKTGASVHILDMDDQGATNVVKEITTDGGKAQFYKCNVSKQADVKQIVDGIAAGGSIDILINNAGIAHIGTADSTAETDFDRLVNVNVKGVYNCLHTILPHMKKKTAVQF